MFNHMQFNSFAKPEYDDLAASIWDYLLKNHNEIPADDFGSLVKELLHVLKKQPKSRILIDG